MTVDHNNGDKLGKTNELINDVFDISTDYLLCWSLRQNSKQPIIDVDALCV